MSISDVFRVEQMCHILLPGLEPRQGKLTRRNNTNKSKHKNENKNTTLFWLKPLYIYMSCGRFGNKGVCVFRWVSGKKTKRHLGGGEEEGAEIDM